MKAKDTEGRYGFALRTESLIGDIVSPPVARRIMQSLFLPDEQPSDLNVQQRLREAMSSGSLDVSGLGPSGLKRLQSALALGKVLYVNTPETGTVIDDPSVAAACLGEISWASVEKFAVLALDVKHRVLSMRVISTGTATETCAHPRDIFSWVLRVGGTRCVVGHNHPSGSLEPSEEDLELTKQLLAAGKVLGLPVLDHLIVSSGDWQSIRQVTCLWAE